MTTASPNPAPSPRKLGAKATIQRSRGTRPRKFVFYGPGSVGKTTLGASAPDVLIVCVEDGASEFLTNKVFFDESTGRTAPQTYNELVDVIEGLKTADLTGIRTLFLDGIHQLDVLIQRHLLKKNPKWETIQTAGFGTGEAAVLEIWREFIALLDDVCLRKNLRLVLSGHAQITKFKNPEGAEYNRYDLAVTIHPKGDVAGFLYGWADVFGFCRFEQLTDTVGKGLSQRTIAVAQQGKRQLHLEWTNAYQAKCRIEGAPTVMDMTGPDGFPRSWAELWGSLEERQADIIRAEIDKLLADPIVDDETRGKVTAWLPSAADDAVKLAAGLKNLRKKIEEKQQQPEQASGEETAQ